MENTETVLELPDVMARTEFFEKFYEQTFPFVAKFIGKRGGSLDDAKDIFHDAIIIFYEKIQNESTMVVDTYDSYVVGIAKHLWIKKFKDESLKSSLDEFERTLSIPPDEIEQPGERQWLALIESAGKKCLDLLRAFYYDKISLEKISKTFGFSGVRSATVQKYKCLEKIRDTVKEKSIGYEDLAG